MKSISAALQTHLDGEVTSLCSCWRIVRRDGTEFYFTDHDADIEFEGNTYEAESSYDRTAAENRADFSTPDMEVAGILDSSKIDEDEMRRGLFNRASVYIFIVNWKDLSQGALKVRRGWFGEVTVTQNGQFKVEIRGLADALTHNLVENYSPECRADFCDQRCKLLIENFEIETTITAAATSRDQFTAAAFAVPSQGLGYGTARFVDGENAGLVMEIIGFDPATRVVTLFEALPYPITVGTIVRIAPGCDGSLDRCIAYGNVINRRAEDFVPGNDELMDYPDAEG